MRYHCARDIPGYIQLSIIFAYWAYGTYMPLNMVLLPYYKMGLIKLHGLMMFGFFSLMVIASLIRSSFFHPGRIPVYKGGVDQSDWSFCSKCNMHRPPRAHHCRRCGHCVARMDHHCPWINNCVGEDNHFAFIQLAFYTIGLCVSAFMFCYIKSYKLPPCPVEICDPESFLFIHEHKLIISQYVLSLLMGISMIALTIGQHLSIALDVTSLESMIAANPMDYFFSKPERPIKYRYDVLCGTKWIFLWFLPCRKRYPLPTKTYTYSQNVV